MRGNLWKCSLEQIRPCTAEENLGAELMRVLSKDMLLDLKKNKVKSYLDISL